MALRLHTDGTPPRLRGHCGVRSLVASLQAFCHDVVEMIVERAMSIGTQQILRWVQRYAPEIEDRWSRFARRAGGSWRAAEGNVKARDKWSNLYCAVDR
jgi:transposase-like protein